MNDESLDNPTCHAPVLGSRPMMSARPSSLKSAVWMNCQFTLLLQADHNVGEKADEPLLTPTQICPLLLARPTRASGGNTWTWLVRLRVLPPESLTAVWTVQTPREAYVWLLVTVKVPGAPLADGAMVPSELVPSPQSIVDE